MSYQAKEIFYSLCGEGYFTGRPAVFCRFVGCNLWSGKEEDRATAICKFCDTDFIGGTRYQTADELAEAVLAFWPAEYPAFVRSYVVLTGGEPLLQVDQQLVDALHAAGFQIGVETNGTRPLPRYLDWLTVSPKAGAYLKVRSGDELKLVYPQVGAEPEKYKDLYFRNFYLQPMAGPNLAENTAAAVEYCLRNPQWRLSLQTHKLLGIR